MEAEPRIVDVHAHFAPPQYLADLAGTNPAMMMAPLVNWSLAKHLEEMEAAGVGRSVLSITTPGISLGDIPNARRMARYCNEYGAELVAAHPRELRQFAALPLLDVDGSLSELTYALDTLGAAGIGVFTSYENTWLGDDAFAPVMEELNRRRAIVYVHPTAPQCCERMLPYIPPSQIEYGTDTTRAITNVIYRGAAARYPDIRFIFSHAGGTMPFLIERFDNTDRMPWVKEFAPEGYRAAARRFFYDTAQSSNLTALGALRTVIPPEQVVFGTDYPYRTMRDHVANLERCGVFSAAEIAGIHSGNVARALPELLA